ncbi:MAG: DNA mismatch repair endonuclease MutL [Lachnospiraceae bacterium]|nr:DNA mismatch repair endonuclease MutL [Lachnospiraceae bacterium]
MAIQVLDQNTINQIAAGEVVERPASVVKELMENAIDAGATAITVEIREGGIGFIRITDNGCGIPKQELPLAFLRHSTSKIRSAEDLLTVSSLGFRGEALSSIAAVSQVELITKTADSLTGSRYQIEGGVEKGLEEVGAPDGTTFISRNLFFNTPARRKFLKTAQTEGAHVADLVEKIALSHPEISIRLIVNNQNKLHTSGNHNLKDIIYTIYGREITANLIPLKIEHEVVRATGFIGKPVIARGNRNFENYFINGRYIKSGLISKAIEDGYKSYMMQHKYPFTMLHFEVEPEYIDVNVHPSKMELRFKDGETMYRVINQAISEALGGRELIPQVGITSGSNKTADTSEASAETAATVDTAKKQEHRAPEPFEVKRMAAMGGGDGKTSRPFMGVGESRAPYPAKTVLPEFPEKPSYSQDRPKPTVPSYTQSANRPPMRGTGLNAGREDLLKEKLFQKPQESPAALTKPTTKTEEPQQLEMFDNRLLSEKARYRHRLIGQVFDTYWLVEYNENLYIIDQHAAHEKVLFEKNFASLKSREYTSQFISPPIILTLSMQEEDLLKRHKNVFTDIGFEIEHFGGNEYAVRAVPDNLFSLAKKELLLEMLDGLADDHANAGSETIYNRIATMSCKAAVKGNNRLSEREANELIDQLLALDNPYTCPHGRPTIIAISKYEMEKKFKRIV